MPLREHLRPLASGRVSTLNTSQQIANLDSSDLVRSRATEELEKNRARKRDAIEQAMMGATKPRSSRPTTLHSRQIDDPAPVSRFAENSSGARSNFEIIGTTEAAPWSKRSPVRIRAPETRRTGRSSVGPRNRPVDYPRQAFLKCLNLFVLLLHCHTQSFRSFTGVCAKTPDRVG